MPHRPPNEPDFPGSPTVARLMKPLTSFLRKFQACRLAFRLDLPSPSREPFSFSRQAHECPLRSNHPEGALLTILDANGYDFAAFRAESLTRGASRADQRAHRKASFPTSGRMIAAGTTLCCGGLV